jgi:hypothetical protein
VHGDDGPSDGPGAARRPATATTRTRPSAEARVIERRSAEPAAPPQRRVAPKPAESDVPLPPEPVDPDDEMPPDPRDEDMTGVSQVVPPPPARRDPDAVAVEMLTEHLRARRIT